MPKDESSAAGGDVRPRLFFRNMTPFMSGAWTAAAFAAFYFFFRVTSRLITTIKRRIEGARLRQAAQVSRQSKPSLAAAMTASGSRRSTKKSAKKS